MTKKRRFGSVDGENSDVQKKKEEEEKTTKDLEEELKKLELKKKIADLEEEKVRKEEEKKLKNKEEKEEEDRKEKEEARVRLNRASIVKTSFDENKDKEILNFIMNRKSIPKDYEDRIKKVEKEIKKEVEEEAIGKIQRVFKRRKERQEDEEKYEKRQEKKIESNRQKSKGELRAMEEVENDFYYSLKPSRDVNAVSKQLGRNIVNASVNKTYDILSLIDSIPEEREDLEQLKIKAETKQAEAEAKQAEVEAKVREQEGKLAEAEAKQILKSEFGVSISNESKEQEQEAITKIYDDNKIEIENNDNKIEIENYNSLLGKLLNFKYDSERKKEFFVLINDFYESLNELFILNVINERKKSITANIEKFLNERQHVDKGIIENLVTTIDGIYDKKNEQKKLEKTIQEAKNLIETNEERIREYKEQLETHNMEIETLKSQEKVLEDESNAVTSICEKYVEQSIKIKTGIKEQLNEYMSELKGKLFENIINELKDCTDKDYSYLKDIETIKNQIDNNNNSIVEIIKDYDSKEDSEENEKKENEEKEILYETLFNILYRFFTDSNETINIFEKLYISFITELNNIDKENTTHKFLPKLKLNYDINSSFKTKIERTKNIIIQKILTKKQEIISNIELKNISLEKLIDKDDNNKKDLVDNNIKLEGKIKEEQQEINELEKDIEIREIEKKEIQTRFNESLDNVKYKNLEIFEIGDNNFPNEILLLDEIQKKFNELNNEDGNGLISEQKEELENKFNTKGIHKLMKDRDKKDFQVIIDTLSDKYLTAKFKDYKVRTVVNLTSYPGTSTENEPSKNAIEKLPDIMRRIEENVIPGSKPKQYKELGNTGVYLPIGLEEELEEDIQDLTDTNKFYGPYYQILHTSHEEPDKKQYRIDDDFTRLMDQKQSVNHITYSGFGFSGSGKTYTLVDSKINENGKGYQSVLRQIIDKLNEKNLNYTVNIYDHYGEIIDNNCIKTKEKVGEKSTTYTIDEKLNKNQMKKNFFTESGIYNKFKKIRENKIENIEQGFSELYRTRVRLTPFNDESSRSHLFIDFNVEGTNPFKITVMDMAGNEDVETIQNAYFNSQPYIDHDKILNISNNLIGYGGELLKNYLKYKEVKDSSVDDLVSQSKFSYTIKEEAWKTLLERLRKNDSIKSVRQKGYKLYKIKPDIPEKAISLQNFLNENAYKVSDDSFFLKSKMDRRGNHKNWRCIDKKGVVITIGGRNNIYDSTIFNYIEETENKFDMYTEVLKDEKFINNYNSYYKQLLTKIKLQIEQLDTKQSILEDTGQESFAGKIFLERHRVWGGLADSYTKDFVRTMGKFFEKTEVIKKVITRILDSMTNIKVNKDITKLSIKVLSKKLKDWDQEYLAKYHCPLRWQGNYIVKTIKEFQQNLVKMNQSDDKNYKGFPYNIGKWNGNDLNDKEFVIFTNIRLDFTDKRNSIDKRYNLRVAFKRSLEFAACLYKDKDYCSPLYVFRDSLQEIDRFSKYKIGGLDKLLNEQFKIIFGEDISKHISRTRLEEYKGYLMQINLLKSMDKYIQDQKEKEHKLLFNKIKSNYITCYNNLIADIEKVKKKRSNFGKKVKKTSTRSFRKRGRRRGPSETEIL